MYNTILYIYVHLIADE